jgi:hypothetical protein
MDAGSHRPEQEPAVPSRRPEEALEDEQEVARVDVREPRGETVARLEHALHVRVEFVAGGSGVCGSLLHGVKLPSSGARGNAGRALARGHSKWAGSGENPGAPWIPSPLLASRFRRFRPSFSRPSPRGRAARESACRQGHRVGLESDEPCRILRAPFRIEGPRGERELPGVHRSPSP